MLCLLYHGMSHHMSHPHTHVTAGTIESVIVGFPDMYGRMMGKRCVAYAAARCA